MVCKHALVARQLAFPMSILAKLLAWVHYTTAYESEAREWRPSDLGDRSIRAWYIR